jgi:hypothetical protein
MRGAEDIVRDLAALPVPISYDVIEDPWCALCDAMLLGMDEADPSNHPTTCLWRRAKEMVERDQHEAKVTIQIWDERNRR